MDWAGVLTALATVVALWQLLGRQIEKSEERNGNLIRKSEARNASLIRESEARNGNLIRESEARNASLIRDLIRESEARNASLIRESEARNNEAHDRLAERIDNGFNRLNDNLLKMAGDIGRVQGKQDRGRDAPRTPDK